MDKKWDVYAYGDINIDLILPNIVSLPKLGTEDVIENMYTCIGGGAALFALGLGKLGMHPVFQGRVGDDCYGNFIKRELEQLSIDTSMMTTGTDEKTGISICFTQEKDRSFLTFRGTNGTIDMDNICLEEVQKAKHIHITGYEGSKNHKQYLAFIEKIKELENISISFDVGWDDTGEWYEGIYDLFPYLDVLFMNETESVHYSKKTSAKEAILDFVNYAKIAVIKMGKEGSIAASKQQGFIKMPGFCVQAVDTTGAGDSFNAGYIYGYLKGKSIEQCLRYGNGCGALSVTAYGGNTGFPTNKILKEFLCQQELIGIEWEENKCKLQ